MKFLNRVDFAQRFAVCFFFRVGGVSAVFEMAWISWAGPMSHLMSDTVDDFEDEMCDSRDAAEAPWQKGVVARNGGIRKAAARKLIDCVVVNGFVEMSMLATMVTCANEAQINASGCSLSQWVVSQGHGLPVLAGKKHCGEKDSVEGSPSFGRLRTKNWLGYGPPAALLRPCVRLTE